MYAYIYGRVDKIYSDYIVLDNNNIGYKVITPNPYLFEVDENVKVYLYMYIREDAHDLFGFKNESEKNLFEKLISVTGIGPKSACAILAPGDVTNVISAIDRGDVTYLTKFPKVGPKTAQQIILDLKGKLSKIDVRPLNQALDEAIEALISLGYKDKEIDRVVKLLSDKQLTTQDYITKALQLMLK
jgi:Holliday junction DNA helicase RuvA